MTKLTTTYKNKSYQLTIDYDHDDFGLLEEHFQGEVLFLTNHRDYSSQGTTRKLTDYESVAEVLEDFQGFQAVPVYALIHGQVHLSLADPQDRWDSGLFGLLLYKPEVLPSQESLQGFLGCWQALLNGEVYWYSLEEVSTCECCSQSVEKSLDSCGGFVGNCFGYMLEHLDCEEGLAQALREALTKEGYNV